MAVTSKTIPPYITTEGVISFDFYNYDVTCPNNPYNSYVSILAEYTLTDKRKYALEYKILREEYDTDMVVSRIIRELKEASEFTPYIL